MFWPDEWRSIIAFSVVQLTCILYIALMWWIAEIFSKRTVIALRSGPILILLTCNSHCLPGSPLWVLYHSIKAFDPDLRWSIDSLIILTVFSSLVITRFYVYLVYKYIIELEKYFVRVDYVPDIPEVPKVYKDIMFYTALFMFLMTAFV